MNQEQGLAALEAGDFASAVAHFETAIETNPDDGAVRYNLAEALRQDGREGDAIIQATFALAREPGLYPAARLLSYLLSHFRLRNPCGVDPMGLVAAFGFSGIDHQFLAPMALSYLKQCTGLGDALVLGGAGGWDAGAQWLLSSRGRDVLRHPLFLSVLNHAVNTDIEIENLLTALRKLLLKLPLKVTVRKPHVLTFACTLARQAEINEYVFAVSDQERQRLDEIFINPKGVRDNSRAAAENLLLKSLYGPTCRLLGEEGRDIDGHTIKPKALGELIAAHMSQRHAEEEAAKGIEILGSIGDEVSLNVARLYEENPYPRWLSLHVPNVADRSRQIASHFSEQECAFMATPYKVLIAGSGTGQQAIDAALGYGSQASLSAIDISLASLAYARYMANQFEVKNLHFLQCDILNVDLFDDPFDIIECVGVLHHMDDPWEGWRRLVEKLRPGGLMRIALYSRTARRSIASLRRDIQARGLNGGDEQAIRDYRQGIMAEGSEGKGAFLLQSADFFSLSNFRDLMFHVSEQHVSIPEIAAFLTNNNLAFHGFERPAEIEEGYPTGDEAMDLDRWRTFEDTHPDTFKGMYVFWCRRAP